MSSFAHQAKLRTTSELIAYAGAGIRDGIFQNTASFTGIPDFEWPGAERWTAFCGMIPAFSFVVAYDDLQRGHNEPSAQDTRFYQDLEDLLFEAYKHERLASMAPLKNCLRIPSELKAFQEIYDVSPEEEMCFDIILGIIFPGRYTQYRLDWIDAILRSGAAYISTYPAMRLEADLRGIATPPSMLGQTARDLGLDSMAFISFALAEFAKEYQKLVS